MSTVELVAITRLNPSVGMDAGITDAGLIQSGRGTDAENLCEYAG